MTDVDISLLDIDAWAQMWNELGAQSMGFTLKELILMLSNAAADVETEGIWQGIASLALSTIKRSMLSYTVIIAISFINAIMGMVSGEEGVGGAGSFICTALGTATVAQRLGTLMSLAYETVDLLCRCMDMIAPVLSVVIAATGSVSTSAAISPLAAFLSGTVAGVFKNAVLPLCTGAGVCAMLCALSAEEKLEHTFRLIKSLIRYVSGGVFTVYFALIGIFGLGARASDSVAVKTAKYALDKGVPIVGGAVSGTVDSVLESAALVKNSVGLAALITVAFAVLAPLINIACHTVCARGTAAICSMLGDRRMPSLLERLADAINGLFASVCVVAAMFVLTCGLATGSSIT